MNVQCTLCASCQLQDPNPCISGQTAIFILGWRLCSLGCPTAESRVWTESTQPVLGSILLLGNILGFLNIADALQSHMTLVSGLLVL
jgi:hypothetical protein